MEWGLSFDEIADVYLDMVRYRHEEYVEPSKWRADIIVNGSSPTDASLEMLTGYIKNKKL
jgi:uridine kinase